ncbi:MAG: SGNH/GDSL hydrolase family protein [Ornithinimicrobium sp.]
MSRADRARDIAARAAFGGGGLAVAGLLGLGVLKAEAQVARRVIGESPDVGLDDSGRYGAGVGTTIELLMLGDSTAAGVGAGSPETTLGATVAIGVAAITGRPVDLRNVSRNGATSADLTAQVVKGLRGMPKVQVAMIMIGSNDVKERVDQTSSVRDLAEAVVTLQDHGARVVVGTCPDLGTIRPVPQPLRSLARRWSRDMAAAQTVAVVEAGGRTVSIGDLIGPDFHEMPGELFSADRFHPSSAGYARAAAAMLPSVLDALGESTADSQRSPDYRRGEAVEPLPSAAERAVDDPGSEVTGTQVDGSARGARGRWAQLLRRQPSPIPSEEEPDGDAHVEPEPPQDAERRAETEQPQVVAEPADADSEDSDSDAESPDIEDESDVADGTGRPASTG